MALTKIGKEGITGISNASDATAITITSGENVGIGETASANLLHVKASDTGIAPHASAQIVLEREGTNYLQFLTAENGTSGCLFGDGSDIDVGKIMYDHNIPAMQFQVETAERMRITSAGVVCIGSSTTDPIANASSSIAITGAGNIGINKSGGVGLDIGRSSSDGAVVGFYRNTSQVGTISVTGSNTAYNTSSDYRLKENVDYTWNATTRLKQLKPARFNFIADDTNTLVDGFIAHEVSSIVPEAITGAKDAVDDNGDAVMQGIDQSKLVPLLVKTIQELEARITALEA